MEENVHDIIAKFLSGNASENERKKLEGWRREPGNEELFKDIENVWHLSLNGKENFSPDINKAWKNVSAMIREEEQERKQAPKKTWYMIAAAAALIPFVIIIAFYKNSEAGNELAVKNPVISEQVIEEPSTLIVNEVFTEDSIVDFYLPDSSHVWLNKNSKFTWSDNFTVAERIVNLEGEAFFEVKKDPGHPFLIYTENSMTRVLGTTFNLKAYRGQKVELTVVSGEVELSSIDTPKDQKVVLHSKDKATLDIKNQLATTTKASKNNEEGWRKQPKKKRFKKFLNRIRNIFKKDKEGKE